MRNLILWTLLLAPFAVQGETLNVAVAFPTQKVAPTRPAQVEPMVTFRLPPRPALDRGTQLAAMSEIESGNNPNKVGRAGELGPYQMGYAAWRQHTRVSFRLARNPEVARTVAERHYDWIVKEFRRHGIEPTAYNVALAWNAGVSAVLSGRYTADSVDHALRVRNTYEDLSSRRRLLTLN